MQPQILDLTNDPRRAHFDCFRTMANPYLSVTAECDITALREKTRREKLPFFLSYLYCAANAANGIAPPIPTRASPLENASSRTAKPACPST